MKTIVITPFYGHTEHLVGNWYNAVKHADEIIAMADGETSATQAIYDLKANNITLFEHATPRGFATCNDLGYAIISTPEDGNDDDLIIFLNSDVAGDHRWLETLKSEARPNELMGASLQAQMVCGRWVPYLEGWCIGGLRSTWKKLIAPDNATSPWMGKLFPEPYWEDNYLSFRAMQAGISLIHIPLALQHLGGQSIGAVASRGVGFEQNRATFAKLVTDTLGNAEKPNHALLRYHQHVNKESDIQHHLPMLKAASRGLVVELGTRTGVSTCAFLAGNAERVISIDISPLTSLFDDTNWSFIQGSSINPATAAQIEEAIDVLLVDTLHNYEHVMIELELWAGKVKADGFVFVHDTETFPGVRLALQDFVEDHPEWTVRFVLPCNGMGILTRA